MRLWIQTTDGLVLKGGVFVAIHVAEEAGVEAVVVWTLASVPGAEVRAGCDLSAESLTVAHELEMG